MPFTPIGDALHEKMRRAGALTQGVAAALVIERAQEALSEFLGVELAKEARPLFLKNRTLTVSCASGAVAQEIRLNQQAIVARLNEKLGKKEVDRIRYLA